MYSPVFLSSHLSVPFANGTCQSPSDTVSRGNRAEREPREAKKAMSRTIHLKGYGSDRSITSALLGAMLGTSAEVGTAFVISN